MPTLNVLVTHDVVKTWTTYTIASNENKIAAVEPITPQCTTNLDLFVTYGGRSLFSIRIASFFNPLPNIPSLAREKASSSRPEIKFRAVKFRTMASTVSLVMRTAKTAKVAIEPCIARRMHESLMNPLGSYVLAFFVGKYRTALMISIRLDSGNNV